MLKEALRRRRVARWRRCCKLRGLVERRIERLERLRAEDNELGLDTDYYDRSIESLKERLSNIVRTIERLEAKERKSVSA